MRLYPEFVFPTATQTGTLTSGSPVVSGLTNTALLLGAVGVSGTGVALDSFVSTINSTTALTLTENATSSGTVSLAFSIEPLMLYQAKKQLRLEPTDITLDDAYIAGLIPTARLAVEQLTRRALITQTRALYLDSFPSAGGYYNRAVREIWPSLGGLPSGLGFYPGLIPNSTGVIDIPLPPLQSITAVRYLDFAGTLQTVDPSAYNVSLDTPGRIQPQYSHVWPISRPTIDSVQITFVAGYGATADKIPSPFSQAMKLLIGHWYEHREEVSDIQLFTVPEGIAKSILASVESGLYY
jgi:hypothetical protein